MGYPVSLALIKRKTISKAGLIWGVKDTGLIEGISDRGKSMQSHSPKVNAGGSLRVLEKDVEG